jgi:hypothetical protein
VEEGSAEIQQMSADSPYFEQFTRALAHAAEITPNDSKSWELRLLRVPALNAEAIWLHPDKGEDSIIPLRTFGGLIALKATSLSDALTQLRTSVLLRKWMRLWELNAGIVQVSILRTGTSDTS